MSKKGYLYSLLAALVIGLFLGFTFGGIFISEKKSPSGENLPATSNAGEESEYRRETRDITPVDQSGQEKAGPAMPSVETKMLMQGTDWQTNLYIIRGTQPEPKILVLGGVHGDEPAAYWSGDAARDLRLRTGTLYVIPHLNEVARRKGTREGLGDINRKFPGNPNGDPEERLCWEISSLIRTEGIRMVMTFHEALGFHSEPPHHPGQTFYYDWDINMRSGAPLTAKARQVIEALNAKIKANPRGYQEKELFTVHVDPIPTSATFELMRQVGVEYAFGCEVCKNNERKRRVWFHLTALTTWMELEGFVIDNWAEVERKIWNDAYTGY